MTTTVEAAAASQVIWVRSTGPARRKRTTTLAAEAASQAAPGSGGRGHGRAPVERVTPSGLRVRVAGVPHVAGGEHQRQRASNDDERAQLQHPGPARRMQPAVREQQHKVCAADADRGTQSAEPRTARSPPPESSPGAGAGRSRRRWWRRSGSSRGPSPSAASRSGSRAAACRSAGRRSERSAASGRRRCRLRSWSTSWC